MSTTGKPTSDQSTNVAQPELTPEQVRYVAKLSAIAVSDEDVVRFQKDLGEILSYVQALAKVDTHGVKPTSHVHGAINFFRDDIIKDSMPLEEVGKNAPDFTRNGFRVPKII